MCEWSYFWRNLRYIVDTTHFWWRHVYTYDDDMWVTWIRHTLMTTCDSRAPLYVCVQIFLIVYSRHDSCGITYSHDIGWVMSRVRCHLRANLFKSKTFEEIGAKCSRHVSSAISLMVLLLKRLARLGLGGALMATCESSHMNTSCLTRE